MTRAAVLAVVVAAACGRGGRPATGPDGQAAGASDAASGAGDAATGDANGDAAALDPATCVVGVADGCCPTAVAYGGHDPDCPTLACGTLNASDPISLDDDWQAAGISGVGMAWTGRELVLAWNATRKTPTQDIQTIVYERRDATGALDYGPVHNDDRETSTNSLRRTPELGFEPTSHSILFASSILYQRYAELLDDTGAPASTQPGRRPRPCGAARSTTPASRRAVART